MKNLKTKLTEYLAQILFLLYVCSRMARCQCGWQRRETPRCFAQFCLATLIPVRKIFTQQLQNPQNLVKRTVNEFRIFQFVELKNIYNYWVHDSNFLKYNNLNKSTKKPRIYVYCLLYRYCQVVEREQRGLIKITATKCLV